MRKYAGLQKVRLCSHEDIPVTAELVVDHRCGMRNKMPDVIDAASSFARSIKPVERTIAVNL